MGTKYQKKESVRGEFAKVKEDIKDGDLIKILDEGQKIDSQWGKRDVFSIETKNGPKNLTFNQTSINNLIEAFGEDAGEWVGKEVKVFIVRQMIEGSLKNVVYLAHPEWEIDEEGRFSSPAKKDPPNSNPDDIPF